MRLLPAGSLQRVLPPVVLLVSLTGLYLRTLAPGLTWAYHGSDGGDLITAAYTGGIAHPSGYPLYLLLARLFQSLPFGSLAYRTNLMSALCTALAAALVYHLVARAAPFAGRAPAWPAGLAAGFAFGLAPLVWSQAVITEVYALQALLVLLILRLYTLPDPEDTAARKRLDCWRGLSLGLGMSNHLTTILLLPPAMLAGSLRRRSGPAEPNRPAPGPFGKFQFDGASLRRQASWLALGCCLYLILPVRALAQPPLNWGNPLTPGRFWWLVSGSLYQGYYLGTGLSGLWERVRSAAALLLEQFGGFGLVLGLAGVVFFWRPSRLYLLGTWTALVTLAFALVYGSADSYVYLIPTFAVFAVWIGLGLGGVPGQVPVRFARFGPLFALLAVAWFAGRAMTHLAEVDASRDLRAETFSAEVLSAAPEGALLFVQGDEALFALWYAHFALAGRPDLAVIATDLLHFDWYQETLRSTYPGLEVPGPFPWPGTVSAANRSRPACYVGYPGRTEIDCFPAVTTP